MSISNECPFNSENLTILVENSHCLTANVAFERSSGCAEVASCARINAVCNARKVSPPRLYESQSDLTLIVG